MTVMGFSKLQLKLVKKWGWYRGYFLKIMRSRVADPEKRKEVNEQYNKMGAQSLSLFHRLFAKMYRDGNYEVADGEWKVFFTNKPVILPIRKDWIWLDWDVAVSVTGHDPEIKKTYEQLIQSGRVKTFFDIGANYGTHSLLFLINGIRTISFEPNNTLKKEFDLYCNLNNVKGEMEMLALGEKNGIVKLRFQSHETWNGTVTENGTESLNGEQMETLDVPLTTMDDYIEKSGLRPDFIKIDTEGNEINVLKGARKTLTTLQPLILFETNNFTERKELWSFFSGINYSVFGLPYHPDKTDPPLTMEQFFTNGANNYVAAFSER